MGRVTEAVDAALDWRLHCPSEAVAYFTHGRLLVAARRYSEGEEALLIARHLDASRPETLYQLALSHFRRGQAQQARLAANEALLLASALEPSLHQVLTDDAQGLAEGMRTEAASASPSSPASISAASPSSSFPPLPPASLSLLCQVDFLLAKVAAQSGDLPAALYHVDRLLAYRPNDPAALMLKAECAQQKGGREGGLRAVRRQPSTPERPHRPRRAGEAAQATRRTAAIAVGLCAAHAEHHPVHPASSVGHLSASVSVLAFSRCLVVLPRPAPAHSGRVERHRPGVQEQG